MPLAPQTLPELQLYLRLSSCGISGPETAFFSKARKRCWQQDWVVDLDIKSFSLKVVREEFGSD